MSYCGYVTTLKDVRKHPNADRLQLATVFGNTVCIGLDMHEGDIVIYFPCDGQLSLDFCLHNNLLRTLPDGNPGPGYMELEKRNVKAIRLRGEKSDGLITGLSALSYIEGVNLEDFTPGTQITVVNGQEVCRKYIPKSNMRQSGPKTDKTKIKRKHPVAPLFQEHKDTEQLAYNLGEFKCGDEVEITLKMHGTSQRTSHTKVLTGYKRTLVDRLFRRIGTPIYDWGYISGTRRTVLENYDGGFYGSNEFREQHAKAFEGKLWKGETVYYEVVGFTHTGTPIMAECNNKKLNDKDFVKKYGEKTVFSYGCRALGVDMNVSYFEGNVGEGIVKEYPQSDLYVYRMTMTNEDGEVVEYTPDFMRYRCEQMGVKTVPVLWKGIIPENPASAEDPTISAGEWIKIVAERFYDGPDPIGLTHVREGVVARILNRPTFKAFKHKNFSFKVLEGIIKEVADAPDMEEADGLNEEDNE